MGCLIGWSLSATVTVLTLGLACGCHSPGQWAALVKQNEHLRRENDRIRGDVAQRQAEQSSLRRQVIALQGFASDRPADLFAPVRVEIASRSGGADYDGKPGDDGITVHLRPRDADGDAVKAPGRIEVQLLDNTDLNNPRVIAVCTLDDPDQIRRAWHGKFGTYHYSIQCPFPQEAILPASQQLLVTATFVDYLTGRKLRATEAVEFRPAIP